MGPTSVLRGLPAGIRWGLRWTPHWLLGGGAALAFFGIAPETVGGGPPETLFLLGMCLLAVAPLALVLSRPVGAFWVSLAAFLATSLIGGDSPLSDLGPLCDLIVMVVVVLRTRPRTAPEMWLLTLGPVAVLSALTHSVRDLPFFTLFSAVVLLAAAAGRAWREERRHLVETETVTAMSVTSARCWRSAPSSPANARRGRPPHVRHRHPGRGRPLPGEDPPPELARPSSPSGRTLSPR